MLLYPMTIWMVHIWYITCLKDLDCYKTRDNNSKKYIKEFSFLQNAS